MSQAKTTLRIERDKILAPLSTFGIGGPARFFATVDSVDAMGEALCFARKEKLRFLILGKGSNCLFDDQGFDGLIILNRIDYLKQGEKGDFEAGAGFSFARLGQLSARQGWSGLEFAAGIPGSVGGAVTMNAGANGQETADVLEAVTYFDKEGRYVEKTREELLFAYRSSPFQETAKAIVSARFRLRKAANASRQQKEQLSYRLRTQPYGEKSAGCVFRNPPEQSAGALIEAAGLKGYRMGGAMVSLEHANFIVNTGAASSADVLALIKYIQQTLITNKATSLQSELHYVPYQS